MSTKLGNRSFRMPAYVLSEEEVTAYFQREKNKEELGMRRECQAALDYIDDLVLRSPRWNDQVLLRHLKDDLERGRHHDGGN